MTKPTVYSICLLLTLSSALIIFAIQMQGLAIVNPNYTDWLYVLNSDYSSHQLGWEFFRQQPWSWPIGKLEQYAYPMVSCIGFTDSIPMLALLFKCINGLLPESFQYFGIWLLGSYLLQGFFGFRIGQRISSSPILSLFLGLFLLLATPLLFRTPHPALCGQWLILAMIYFYFDDKHRRSIKFSVGTIAIATLIHPYLMVMCLAIGMATFLKWMWKKQISILWWLILNVGILILIFFFLWSIGYFLIKSDQAVGLGLGEFSANLNSFVNAMDLGQIMSALPLAFSGQYEGYAYIGFGLLILIMPAIWPIIVKFKSNRLVTKSTLPLLLAIAGLAVLAISPIITMGSCKIFEFELGHNLFNTFRSSGRFIWPAYYGIVIFIFWGLSRHTQTLFMPFFIAAAFAVQCFDIWPLLSRPILQHQSYQSPLNQEWESIFKNIETAYLFPPFRQSYATGGDVLHFLELARKTKTNITAGHLARRDDLIADSLYKKINLQFKGLEPYPNSGVYIASISSLPLLKNSLDTKKGVVKKLQDYLVFIPNEVMDQNNKLEQIIKNKSFESLDGIQIVRLEEWMSLDTNATYVISLKDEASRSLCEDTKSYFENINSVLSTIGFRESYLGIFKNHQVLFEEKGFRKLEYNQAIELNPGRSIDLQIESAGSPFGNISSIRIDSKEFSLNQRGLNVLKIDDTLYNPFSINFDLYEQCAEVLPKI